MIAVGLAVVFVAWLLLRGGENKPAATRAPATAMNLTQLRAFAASAGHPVYWAGPRPSGAPAKGLAYEVSQTRDRSIYIRYLPPGVAAGSNRLFLTVGTYVNGRARATVRQALARPGATRARGPGRETAVVNASRPHSVYFAAPDGRFLIEVYDPNAARARSLASTVGPIR
ncbi:MAG: hypothetical protein ACJ76S_03225 [Solirubrobacteraceae bacterium]